MRGKRKPSDYKYEIRLQTQSTDIRVALDEVVKAMDEMADMLKNPRWGYKRRRLPPMGANESETPAKSKAEMAIETKTKRFQTAVANVEAETRGELVIGNKQIERNILEYLYILAWDRAVYDRDVLVPEILKSLDRLKQAAEKEPGVKELVKQFSEETMDFLDSYRSNMYRNAAIIVPGAENEPVAQDASESAQENNPPSTFQDADAAL